MDSVFILILIRIFADPIIDPERILQELRKNAGKTLEMLREIDEIRSIILGRNYSELRSLVERELNLSRGALRDSDRYIFESKLMHGNVVEYGPKFDSFEAIFRNQLRKASSSVADSKNGERINKQASSYKSDVSDAYMHIYLGKNSFQHNCSVVYQL